MNSPKKIVISYNTARYLYRFRIGIIKELIRRKHKVYVVVPRDDYSPKLQEIGCTVYDIKMDNKGINPLSDLNTLLEYYQAYKKIEPDVALHFTIKPNIYGGLAARVLRIPCVNMITGLGTAFIKSSWLTKVVELLYKASQSWPYKVLFQNVDDLNLFLNKKLVTQNQAKQVASSGVNLEEFKIAVPVNNPYPVFLFIGRMIKDKGVFELIEAARQIKTKYPNVRFLLLGQLDVENRTAISKSQMESWVSEGVVEFMGETNDVRPYIEQSDCVVLPSYREGLSRTLLEASAMAKPVVATNVTGCREIVEHGQNGYLCNVKDSDDLANKLELIVLLSGNQRIEMGILGREKMNREFNEEMIVKRYIDVVEMAINHKEQNL